VTDHLDDALDLTLLLAEWRQGDAGALNEVMEYVYNDLHRRASVYLRHERPDHTLGATGLVHEAFIKLVEKKNIEFNDRDHFFAVAAQAMRRILVDHARGKDRKKRGDGNETLLLDDTRLIAPVKPSVDLVALDEALARLAEFDPRQAQVVELKYFGGMTLEETADVLGVSAVTVKRDWQIARAWLRQEL